MSNIKKLFLILTMAISATLVSTAQEQTHVVESGDNLFRIALDYGVDINVLAEANGIEDVRRIYRGQTLVIPGITTTNDVTTTTVANDVSNPLVASAPSVHIVQRGEYVSQIAQQYNITVQQLLDANNIANANRIFPGQELQIWASAPITDAVVAVEPAPVVEEPAPIQEVVSEPVADEYVTHIVQEGEYLSGIAAAYNLSWTSVAQYNGITNPDRVYAGLELRIPTNAPTIGLSAQSTSGTIDGPVPRWGTGREIVVDLSTQMVYAFDNGVLQYSSISSTGLPATPTVQGDFAIWHKTPSQTMSGPGYSLPNVEWVMYFYQGYGLHGTYWHSNFGNPMSHGCVNLTNDDAYWYYQFASIGTPVHVRW